MSEPWVQLADVPSVADERWLHGLGATPVNPVRIVGYEEFCSREEELAEALLGTTAETLLPANGTLLMYGDGGAGKTTLTIDAVCHLAAGHNWIAISVNRPVRVLVIENEGPRGKFRQLLAEKATAWNGNGAYQHNVSVLEEPWTRFTLRDVAHREALAAHCMASEVDLLVMGPLVTLGMVGGGTPDEVSAFELLLKELRELIPRDLAFWIVHHENKAGDVSGAWERVPDTLCHVQAQGNGHTRLHWRKARWSSELHGTSLDLVWSEGRSFTVPEVHETDPYEDMLEAFRKHNEWHTAKEAGKLITISENEARKVLRGLTARGELVFEIGPAGRHGSAHCWRLQGALGVPAHLSAPSPDRQDKVRSGSIPPPIGGGSLAQVVGEPEKGALDPERTHSEEGYDEFV